MNGRGYVVASTTPRDAQAGATFTWNTTPGSVTVNAEDRTLSAFRRWFTDSFGPYQAHVYVIGSGGNGNDQGGDGNDQGEDGGGNGPKDPEPQPTPGSPTVAFSNPAPGATVHGATTVTLAGSGGSGGGYTYRVTVGGTNIYTGTNGTFSWNTANVPNGNHMC